MSDAENEWDEQKGLDRCLAEIGGCRARALKLTPQNLNAVSQRLMEVGVELSEQAGLEFDAEVSTAGARFGGTAERKLKHYANDIKALKGIIGGRGKIIKDLRRRKNEWKRRAKELGYSSQDEG